MKEYEQFAEIQHQKFMSWVEFEKVKLNNGVELNGVTFKRLTLIKY